MNDGGGYQFPSGRSLPPLQDPGDSLLRDVVSGMGGVIGSEFGRLGDVIGSNLADGIFVMVYNAEEIATSVETIYAEIADSRIYTDQLRFAVTWGP